MRSLEVLGFLEIRKGASGGAFVTEVDLKKARDCFTNFLHFKNLSIRDLAEVRLLLESYIAEKAAFTITEEDLKRLRKLNDESDYVLKHDIPIESRKNEIEFHRIIGCVTGNPILMFILDFVETFLLIQKRFCNLVKNFPKKSSWPINKFTRPCYKKIQKRSEKK
jgi:GntR family transcriptional repressor for pyruvate dehydrogenase complex